jgi:hypothetical protein
MNVIKIAASKIGGGLSHYAVSDLQIGKFVYVSIRIKARIEGWLRASD